MKDEHGEIIELIMPIYRDGLRTIDLESSSGVLIRCMDCMHGEPCNEGDIYCTKDIGTFESPVHKPEWFCACGERRETE